MRLLLVLFVALLPGFGCPAIAQTPHGDEKPPEGRDWTSLLGLDRPASGQTRYDTEKTPEGWAWTRIKRDEVADLNLRCDPSGTTRLDSHADAGWDDTCRKIPASVVADVLTNPRLRDRIGRHGFRLQGARIDGDLDLANASIGVDLGIDASRIDGSLNLTGAHLAGILSLQRTQVNGDFAAERLRADANLFLRDHATFKGNVRLLGGKIGGQLNMDGSAFAGTITADSLSVETSLFLRGAIVRGNLILRGARVGGQVDMDSSTFGQTIDADSLSVGSSLFLSGATFLGEVILRGAKVEGQVSMIGSVFEQSVDAGTATIGKSMLARNARFAQPVSLTFTHIVGGLNLTGAVANRIDLANAVIGDDLLLGDSASQLHWQCTGFAPAAPGSGKAPSGTSWPLGDRSWRTASCGTGEDHQIPAMVLRNTHVGALQDNADSWPPELDLEGFRYDRLGGLNGTGAADMRQRSPKQWRDWLDRDRIFSAQPYTQLASVLVTSGHRATADSMLYFGRERERHDALERGEWYLGAWLSFLWAIAGYGIGLYTFRVLYWVGGLTLLGTLVLLFAAKARRHGFLWCFGASLQRLLPVVEFNKSFKDFFDNPPPASDAETRNLRGWQVFFFSGLALAGWVIGFVLLAAMTNLTPKF